MQMLKFVGCFILAVEIFVALNILVSQDNPCSAWAHHPQACSSDLTQDLGK